MTTIARIEASIRRRGIASPAEILCDVGARDQSDCKTACALIEEMVREGKVEARELRVGAFRIPMFRWNYQAQGRLL